jgi:hypothetical protein
MKKYLIVNFFILFFWLGSGRIYSAEKINFPILNLPATLEQLQEAGGKYPDLIDWSKNGQVLIFGDQSLLLKRKLPLVRLENCVWADKLTGRPLRILIVSTLQHEGSLMYFPSSFPADWIRVPAYYPSQYSRDGLSSGVLDYSLSLLKKAFAIHPDVIILTYSAGAFPSSMHKFILKYVKDNGAGLILSGLNYGNGSWLWWNKFYGKQTPLDGNIRILPPVISSMSSIITKNYPSFGGIPFGIFPPVNVYGNVHLVNRGVAIWSTKNGIPLVAMKKYGKGIIMATGWVGLFPQVGGGIIRPPKGYLKKFHFSRYALYQRYFTSALSKLILFAAGRKPPAWIKFSVPDFLEWGNSSNIVLHVKGQQNDVKTVNLILRNTKDKIIMEKNVPVSGTINIQIPVISADRYVLDATLINNKGEVISWYSDVIKINSPVSIIAAANHRYYIPGSTAVISGKVSGKTGIITSIMLQVSDVENHLWAQDRISPDANGNFSWKYNVVSTPNALQRVKVKVFSGKDMICSKSFYISETAHTWNDFINILWGGNISTIQTPDILKAEKRYLGLDADVDDREPGSGPLDLSSMFSGLPPFWTQMFGINPGDLTENYDEVVKREEQNVPVEQEYLNRYGGVAASVQDERSEPTEIMPGKDLLKMFRIDMQKKYRTIEKLNSAWNTSFTSFSTMAPLSESSIGKNTYNIAGWLEYRLWFSQIFTELDKNLMDKTLSGLVDPKIYYGIDGLFGTRINLFPYTGFDYSTTPFTMLVSYGRNTTNLARSFVKGPITTWWGYDNPKHTYFTMPWWGLLHGYWGMGWFWGDSFMSQLGGVYKQSLWVKEVTKPLRDGIGKLVIHSREQTDPVVILYSQSSLYTEDVIGRWVDSADLHLFQRPVDDSRHVFQNFLAENGIDYRYISEKQIQKGGLKNKKLLILSGAFALSWKTCEAIKSWVKNGGTVIADVLPDILNDIGSPSYLMDSLFGVKANRFKWGMQPFDYLVWDEKTLPNWHVTGWFAGEYFEKNLQVSNGKALGKIIFQQGYKNGIPCFVYKKYGNGNAMLLNFLLSAYTRTNNQWSNLLGQQILSLAGIKPVLLVRNQNRVPLQGFEITRWQNENAEYFGIFRREDSSPLIPSNVYLFFKKPGYTYLIGGENSVEGKMISDKYLGFLKKIKINLSAGGVIMIARIPYKIERLDATLVKNRKSFTGVSILVHLITSGGSGYTGSVAPYVVHVSVFDPSGNQEDVLTKNVILYKENTIVQIPLFLNAPKGRWKVILREIISGEKAKVLFKIVNPQ